MKSNQRESWLDALRGFAMIMVVWGHCERTFFYNAIYKVNVTLFIMISGYLLGYKISKLEKGQHVSILGILKNHLYPYVTYGLLFVIIKYTNFLLEIKSFGVLETYNFGDLFRVFLGSDAGTNWFLVPLVLAEVIYILLDFVLGKLIQNKYVLPVVIMLFAVALTLGVELVETPVINHLRLSAGLMQICVSWVYMVQRAVAFIYYLGLGVLLFNLVKHEILSKKIRLAFGCVFCIMFCIKYNPDVAVFSEVRWLRADNTIHYFLISTCGCVGCFLLFSVVKCELRLLQHIGKNTLIINGTHLTFGILDVVGLWYYRYPIAMVSPVLNSIIVFTLTMLIELVLVVPVFNNSLQFMGSYKTVKKWVLEIKKLGISRNKIGK